MSAIARRRTDRALATASLVWPWAARAAGGRLLRQHRFAEAEALLAAAARAFPRHAGVRARHALTAEAEGRFAEAAERWRLVCALQPDHVVAWRSLSSCLRTVGDSAGAAAAVERAAALRPNDWAVRFERARVFDCVERHAEAAEIWEQVVRRRPDDPLCRQGYADCLIRLERFDDAERQIAAGFERHPDHRCLVASQGLLAIRRQNLDEAFAVWSRYAQAYPDDHIGRDFLARVANVRQLESAAQGRPSQALLPANIEVVEDEAARALVLGFESIGADCEFGLVQRRHGAEPLGLLRWADVTPATLVAALEARFSDMGEPEVTELVVMDSFLFVRDRRWDLNMNTFLFAREVSADALYPKMCRRVAFLRDKFVEDLGAADKILIFKGEAIDLAGLKTLHERFAAYGPSRLLHVRLSPLPGWDGLDAEVGTTVQLAPGLHLGRLSRYGNDGPVWDIAYDEWVAMCRSVAMVEPVEA